MKNYLFRLTYIALAVFLVPTAYGQNSDWYVAPAVVFTNDDGDRNIDDSVAGGQLSFGRAFTESTSIEGLFGYSDINGFPGQRHLELGVNVLAFIDRDSTFAPYILAGVGYLGTSIDNGGEENRPTGTFGVGFKWALGDSALSIRAEHRSRIAYEQDNNLTDQITTIGLQFSFGAATTTTRRETGFDSDGDGVIDHWDRCPATRRGVAVDQKGCPLDSDGDGVADGADVCPNTAAGVQVDLFGCLQDSDRDGVSDDKDKCRNTPAGAEVDVYGCERDDDADRVINRQDKCPNSPAGVRVDINGCEIKDVIVLAGVNFESNSDRLLPGAEQVLAEAAATLRKHPDLEVEVAGHTDSNGAAAANKSLSERRAQTVRDYLIRAGADPTKLTAKGYGETRPVADNTSARGRTTNRRVELNLWKP